uniref:Putative secreted protein n=1 Tax=Rhipicephalus microplus TaxID=6941 RepID=A0A6G5A084_RHIMP
MATSRAYLSLVLAWLLTAISCLGSASCAPLFSMKNGAFVKILISKPTLEFYAKKFEKKIIGLDLNKYSTVDATRSLLDMRSGNSETPFEQVVICQ